MITYEIDSELVDGKCQMIWRDGNRQGVYVEGQKTKRQAGMTEEVLDDEGEVVIEAQPIIEEYEPYAELIAKWQNDEIEIEDLRPTPEDLAQQERKELISRAKATRDKAIDENINVLDATWQVDHTSRDRMRETINVAHDLAYPPEATVPWRIADNTYRDTTADELKQVLAASAQRMSVIFQQFGAWEDSSSTEEFTIE